MKHPASKNTRTTFSSLVQEDVQPNAIDVRIDRVFLITQEVFVLSETIREHRKTHPLKTQIFRNEDEWWCLLPGTYSVHMRGTIKVPKEEAGFILPRSSLNRNGVYITSGLYDSGYEGEMVATLHVTCGPFWVRRWTRVGQFLLFEAETMRMYNGVYGMRGTSDKELFQEERKEVTSAPRSFQLGLPRETITPKGPKPKPKPKRPLVPLKPGPKPNPNLRVEKERAVEEAERVREEASRGVVDEVGEQVRSAVDELKNIL